MSTLFSITRTFSKFFVISGKNRRILKDVSSHLTTKTYPWTCKTPEIHKSEILHSNIVANRSFAKTKDKVRKGTTRVVISEQELSEVFNVEKLYSDFNFPITNLKRLFLEQLSLRTSSSAIEGIKVKYDGDTYTIQDLAEIGKKNPKEVILDMSAFVDAIPNVMESLQKSALRLNPSQEGNAIVVPIPKVTREHRESLAKGAKALFNSCRTQIRDIQSKNIKRLESANVSKDDEFRLKAQLTALGDKHIAEAEEIFKMKEKELLSTE